ncbi:MAG: DNA translocase FtsK 4TM domain-containing protein, partial [Actinomycetota bacterium]
MASKRRTEADGPSRRSAPERTPVREHLAPWARDAIGIALVVGALIGVLALWFEAAGPLGRWLATVVRVLVGRAAVTVPVVALGWGVALLRDAEPDVRARRAVGFTLLATAVLALISLGVGNPAPLDGVDALETATGLIGALAAWPLAELISVTGAGIVWTGLVVLGLLLFTGTFLGRVAERTTERLGAAREERRARRAATVYDQEAVEPDEDDVDEEPAPRAWGRGPARPPAPAGQRRRGAGRLGGHA